MDQFFRSTAVLVGTTPLSVEDSGVVQGGGTNAASLVLPGLSTTGPNRIICVAVITNAAGTTGSSGSSLGSFAQRATQGGANRTELWWKLASAQLSSEVITITNSGTQFLSAYAFAVAGVANTAAPFDSNVGLPSIQETGATLVSISTSNANDLLIGAYRMGSVGSPTAGAGWTQIGTGGSLFFLVEYKIVAATQSGVTIPIGTGNTDENGGFGDALAGT